MKTPSLVACSLVALGACTEPDFPAYNELSGLRVLAIRAEPADLVSGESTTLDALVYSEGDAAISHQWSLCPWASDPNAGFPCPVSRANWDEALAQAGLAQDALSLELGAGETAQLRMPDDRDALVRLCKGTADVLGAAYGVPPDCEVEWNLTVRLTVSSGKKHIDSVKNVRLWLSDAPSRNQNPTVDALAIRSADDGERDPAAPLATDADYLLLADIGAAQAETYLPTPVLGQDPSSVTEKVEALTFTWFVEGGETARTRSTYHEGAESLHDATRCIWTTPEEARQARTYVVVRDHRGGVGFARRDVSFIR